MKSKFLILPILALLGFTIYEYQEYKKVDKKLNQILANQKYEIQKDNLEKKVNTLINEITEKYEIDQLIINNPREITNNFEIKKNSLNAEIKDKTEKLIELLHELKMVNNKYEILIGKIENEYIIKNVMQINQYEIGYPTGCESVALTILLNYWKTNVSVEEVANLLKKGDKPYIENGIKYGGNPYIEFIGEPTDPYSYGVYDKPIEEVANKLKPGIINGTGISLNEVLSIVKQGRPVIVWCTMNMNTPYINSSWIYKETGERINWLSSLHAIVVIGYTKDKIITSDSLTGTIRYFDKNVFENRYNAFGKRALYY